MQYVVRATQDALEPHLPAFRVLQRQHLGHAAAHILIRLVNRLPTRPRLGMDWYGPASSWFQTARPRLAPSRWAVSINFFRLSVGVGDNGDSLLRGRCTRPVSHQVRLFCQDEPASCKTHQSV